MCHSAVDFYCPLLMALLVTPTLLALACVGTCLVRVGILARVGMLARVGILARVGMLARVGILVRVGMDADTGVGVGAGSCLPSACFSSVRASER